MPRRAHFWPWITAWIILAIYTAAYASMIRQYHAVPYWDQSGYVLKTYNLVEQWNAAGAGESSFLSKTTARLDPNLYLNAAPPLRPPLLEMLPALIWRHRATPHDMAYTWLLLRVAFLMAGAWLLARHVGDARWVPAAFAVTLASQGFLKLNQNLYLMDVPFACCALFAAALAARAMRRRSMRACLFAGAGTIALLLIKPQALAFMFPFYLFLLVERIFYERRAWKERIQKKQAQLLALLRWLLALLLLLLAIVYLLQSPYGHAAAYQYALNTQGFWAHGIDSRFLLAILAGLVAPWLAVLALGATVRALSTHPPVVGQGRRKLALFVLVAAAWWVCFNLFLSFGIDPRLVWSIAPLVVCIACIAAWRIRWCGIVASVIALVWFLLALLVTTGLLPAKIIAAPVAVVGPPIVYQKPHAEIGLLPFAAQCEKAIRAVAPAPRDAWVETMACDEFVEADALNLAARWINNNHPSLIHYQAAPWGDGGFDIAEIFNGPASGWYLTKTVRPTTTLNGSAFINLMAIHALITQPGSPIHSLFDPVATGSIVQPVSAETSLLSSPAGQDAPTLSDSLVLWQLRRHVTPKECSDALTFIAHRYQKEALARIEMQRRRLRPHGHHRHQRQRHHRTRTPPAAPPPRTTFSSPAASHSARFNSPASTTRPSKSTSTGKRPRPSISPISDSSI